MTTWRTLRHKLGQPGVAAALGAALLFGAGTPLAERLRDGTHGAWGAVAGDHLKGDDLHLCSLWLVPTMVS